MGLAQQGANKDLFAFNALPALIQHHGFEFGTPPQRYPLFGQDYGNVFGARRPTPFAFGISVKVFLKNKCKLRFFSLCFDLTTILRNSINMLTFSL